MASVFSLLSHLTSCKDNFFSAHRMSVKISRESQLGELLKVLASAGWRDGSEGRVLATKLEDLILIPRTHVVEGET